VKAAIRLLTEGETPHSVIVTTGDGKRHSARVQSGPWKGREPQTLEQRYHEWQRTWKKLAEEQSIEISTT